MTSRQAPESSGGSDHRTPPLSRARAREIFLDAIERTSPDERRRCAESACGDDPELRRAVELLLSNHRDDDFLEQVPEPVRAVRMTLEQGLSSDLYRPGMRLGRYLLHEELGEGGCGIVFRAEQVEPVRREVALKVIKPGMDSRAVVQRFASERQTLALLDHPNIARVFDAGTSESGHPFFVMELVRGMRLTEFCDQHRLSIADRVELLVQVTRAVEHAHQKGIIHRDLKPSNLLVAIVDGRAVPKVIDFGVAKAMQSSGPDSAFTTQIGALIGTPAYMSPEQLGRGSSGVDIRTDVYALGALLYELIVGLPPHGACAVGDPDWDGFRQRVCEDEVRRPSDHLQTLDRTECVRLAAQRRTDPRNLIRQARGDLDWIVLHALEKDRSRRYTTAGELAVDLLNYLADRPATAGPPGRWYRASRFVRRHRVAVGTAMALAALMMGGLAVCLWQLAEKVQALERARVAESQERFHRLRLERANREETRLRGLANEQRLEARQHAYAADMNLAQQALAANNLGRALSLLERHRPLPGDTDLRGWEWRYLWQFCQSDARFVLCQGTNSIVSLSLSPDNQWVVAGESGSGLSLWNLKTRTFVARLPDADGHIRAAVAPGKSLLAYAVTRRPGGDSRASNRVVLCNPDDPTNTATGNLPIESRCRGLWFSPDGERLLVLTDSGELTVWSTANCTQISRASAPPVAFFGIPSPTASASASASPSLDLVALGDNRGNVRLIETSTGRERWSTHLPPADIRSVGLSPNGQWVAAAGGIEEPDIWILEAATGREVARLAGHGGWVSSLAFRQDGTTLLSAGADQTIRFWDLRQFKPSGILRGHVREIWSMALSTDGNLLLSGSKEGTVNVWDPSDRSQQESYRVLPGRFRDWEFAGTSNSLITLSANGEVRNWPLPRLDASHLVGNVSGHLASAVFAPKAEGIAVLTTNRTVRLWKRTTGGLAELSVNPRTASIPVAFAGSVERLLTWNPRDGVFQLWKTEHGDLIDEWPGRSAGPGIRVAATAEYVATMEPNGVCRLRHLPTRRTDVFATGMREIGGLGFAPDGRNLALVSGAGTALLLKTDPFSKDAILGGFLLGIHGLGFSPNGDRLALGSNGREAVKLFDVQYKQELLTLEGQGTFFHRVAFGPGGEWLAAMSRDGKLHLWHAPDLNLIDELF